MTSVFWWSSSWFLHDLETKSSGSVWECSLAISFGGTSRDFELNPINGPELYILGFYVSTETITSVGFGDIVPVSPVPKLLCSLEMFLGLFFSVFIVSGALEKFAKPPSKSTKEIKLTALISEARQNEKEYLVRWLDLRRKWVRFRDSDTVRGCRTRVRKVHVLVSLTVQFFAMLLLVVYRQNLDNQDTKIPLLILFVVFCPW